MKYEDLDLHTFGLHELRENTLLAWFQNLVTAATSDAQLIGAVSASPQFKALFSESSRIPYFVRREDLDARVRSINEFRPDITLIIHYDADPTTVTQTEDEGAKAYVPGAFAPEELATRESRAYFAEHGLDPVAWPASVALSQQIVNHLATELGIPRDPYGGEQVKQISPGVFSRNLLVSRKLTHQVVSYVECLHYGGAREFKWIAAGTHPLLIGGENHPYSDRVSQVAQALKNAVVDFVRRGINP